MTLRPIRAYREISDDLSRLRAEQRTADADARRELLARANLFSMRSKKVVDETMTLSAVLMRAGEVDEANRLLAEVDREVAEQKVALIESVNEVKTRQVAARERMTRLKMARMLLTAILGASLMMFSAFGVALAKFFAPAPAQGAQEHSIPAPRGFGGHRSDDQRMKHIRFAGVKIALTSDQLEEFKRLTAAGADDDALSQFLAQVLSKDVADKILATAAPATDLAAGLVGTAKKAAEQSTTSGSGQQTSASEKKQSDKSSSASENEEEQSGTEGSGGEEEGCEPDEGEGDTNTLGGPGGTCIPVVNKESPV